MTAIKSNFVNFMILPPYKILITFKPNLPGLKNLAGLV